MHLLLDNTELHRNYPVLNGFGAFKRIFSSCSSACNLVYVFISFFFFFFFGLATCEILAPCLGIQCAPPTLEEQSLNHQTAREVPVFVVKVLKL